MNSFVLQSSFCEMYSPVSVKCFGAIVRNHWPQAWGLVQTFFHSLTRIATFVTKTIPKAMIPDNRQIPYINISPKCSLAKANPRRAIAIPPRPLRLRFTGTVFLPYALVSDRCSCFDQIVFGVSGSAFAGSTSNLPLLLDPLLRIEFKTFWSKEQLIHTFSQPDLSQSD